MVVVSVYLSGKDLAAFDEAVRKLGFTSRSDAVRDVIAKFLIQNVWDRRLPPGDHYLISVVYPARKKHRVLQVIHDYSREIRGSSHNHFDDRCVDQLLLQGDTERIQEMIRKLNSFRDVRICNCIV